MESVLGSWSVEMSTEVFGTKLGVFWQIAVKVCWHTSFFFTRHVFPLSLVIKSLVWEVLIPVSSLLWMCGCVTIVLNWSKCIQFFTLQPNGFNIEITNTNPRVIMVGVRIQIGCQSVEKAPSFVEIFGRVIQLTLTRNRWFDLPFTREESLTADKKFSLFSE